MAARWRTGEETLTACNMDLSPLATLDETDRFISGGSLDSIQSCLDPSILSIFEDTPTVETKDEESETMLLTALTEILDNVEDENLSPFDTLPDSELLSTQKGREHSPLRRMLYLSCSPQEKDSLNIARPLSTGKSLPRMQGIFVQRSDGEEEEDGSINRSPIIGESSSPDGDLPDWEGLTLPLPITFQQESEGDHPPVSLGDFVRHMHPYCMTICVENEQGEHMLPEGGILLEVVDKGENGEPILAIPNIDLPISVPLKETSSEKEQSVSDEAEEVLTDSSEHIVVDDEDDVRPNKELNFICPVPTSSDTKAEIMLKKEAKTKNPTRRKRKLCVQPKPTEGRVLRSGTVCKTTPESLKKAKKLSVNPKVSGVPPSSTPSSKARKEIKHSQTKTIGKTTATELSECNEPVSPEQENVLSNAAEEKQSSAPQTNVPKQPVTAAVETEGSTVQPSGASSGIAVPASNPEPSENTGSASVTPPEPKPKSLSLEEYRRLRQQRKPTPVEVPDNNSTKWPSLPEPPKELPPIPCLLHSNPKDPRRPGPQAAKKDVEEVRPAWQPRGPGVPPTPEALLVPPAYMMSSTSKVAASAPASKTQDVSRLPQMHPPPAPNSVKNSTQTNNPVQPGVPSVSSVEVSTQNASSKDGTPSPVPSQRREAVDEQTPKLTQVHPTPVNENIRAASKHPSKKPLETTACSALNSSAASDGKSPKLPANSPQTPSGLSKQRGVTPMIQQYTKRTAAILQKANKSTQELIEAFTNEIGIEAADLTSLLEQFEETQAKEEQCVPEVCGRAAAVGNSSIEPAPEKTVVERVRANDFSSIAALTPPATPPHQMWKPLAPVASLRVEGKAGEGPKVSPSKVIQIDPQPLPSARPHSKLASPAAAAVSSSLACMDHDYCLPNKQGTSSWEQGKRWNVKQQSSIVIQTIKDHAPSQTTQCSVAPTNTVLPTKPQDAPQTERPGQKTTNHGPDGGSILETPAASPSQLEAESTYKIRSPRSRHLERSYRRPAASRTPSPRYSRKERTRGRSEKRSRYSSSPMSSSSDSCSSRSRSRSCSPAKKRYHHSDSRSRSSSSSSSRSSRSVSPSPPRRRRYSYSSSRSGSWSRSRSRSRSPQKQTQWNRSRRLYSPTYRPRHSNVPKANAEEIKRRKEKAIEERRIVYVGRIRGTMTQRELRERFSVFGRIEECTLHFRDHGDNYGFVTFFDTKDAFTAIENGSKLRNPDELPFDLCFGGRRQFCQSNYADLDSSRDYEPLPTKGKLNALDFDTLLKQAQQNLRR